MGTHIIIKFLFKNLDNVNLNKFINTYEISNMPDKLTESLFFLIYISHNKNDIIKEILEKVKEILNKFNYDFFLKLLIIIIEIINCKKLGIFLIENWINMGIINIFIELLSKIKRDNIRYYLSLFFNLLINWFKNELDNKIITKIENLKLDSVNLKNNKIDIIKKFEENKNDIDTISDQIVNNYKDLPNIANKNELSKLIRTKYYNKYFKI